MFPLEGEITREGSAVKKELVVAEIDHVAEARRRLPFWPARRPELYKGLTS